MSDIAPPSSGPPPHTSLTISNGALPNGVAIDHSQGTLCFNPCS